MELSFSGVVVMGFIDSFLGAASQSLRLPIVGVLSKEGVCGPRRKQPKRGAVPQNSPKMCGRRATPKRPPKKGPRGQSAPQGRTARKGGVGLEAPRPY